MQIRIICGSFDHPRYTEGKTAYCSECNSKLWLSNSSIEGALNQIKGLKLEQIDTVCMKCGFIDLEGKELPKLTIEQQKDLLQTLEKLDKSHTKESHREL